MQKVPSTQSAKSVQQTKSSEIKTNTKAGSDEKTSTTAKQGDDTKKPADNTDHTTISTSFCGCKKDKCDAFFEKLLCYLEKQSDIIAKCCAHSREHRRDSCQEIKPKRPKDPCKDDSHNTHPKDLCKHDGLERFTSSQEIRPKHPSPCKDDPEPNFHRRASVETQKSLKGKSKDRNKDCPDGDSDSKSSRYKSQLDEGRQLRLGDKPCNIYVEVCSCRKEGKRAHASRGSQKTTEADCEQYSFGQRLATPPRRQPSRKSNEYGIDCHGCEKKVCYFFKLAEEICQGYMKQCQEEDPNRAQSNHSGKIRNSRENVGNQFPSRPYQAQPWNEGSDENDMKPEKLSAHERDPYSRPHAMPVAIEIECLGTKEEFIVEPCQCVERCPDSSYGRGKPSPVASRVDSQGPKKSCLEVFEERYGKILRDLHTKLFPDPKPNPPPAYPPQVYPPQGYPLQGYPQQGYPPQGYPPPGYPNPYGDAAPQPPPPQLPPTQQPPPPLPKQEDPPPTKQETKQPPKESKQSEDDDSSEEKKKPKKKDKKEDKKKKKKKGSKDS